MRSVPQENIRRKMRRESCRWRAKQWGDCVNACSSEGSSRLVIKRPIAVMIQVSGKAVKRARHCVHRHLLTESSPFWHSLHLLRIIIIGPNVIRIVALSLRAPEPSRTVPHCFLGLWHPGHAVGNHPRCFGGQPLSCSSDTHHARDCSGMPWIRRPSPLTRTHIPS